MTVDSDQPDRPPASKSSRKMRIIDLVRPHWKALTHRARGRAGRNADGHSRAVAHQDRRRQHPAVEEASGSPWRNRDRALRPRHVCDPQLRRGRRRRHRDCRCRQLLLREIPDDERQPVGGTRPAANAVPPHSAAVARRTRQGAERRSDHAGHQRHRGRSGLHQLGACSACWST